MLNHLNKIDYFLLLRFKRVEAVSFLILRSRFCSDHPLVQREVLGTQLQINDFLTCHRSEIELPDGHW